MRILSENIHKSFLNKKILAGVTEEVGEGEVLVLLGPNGAGKTTYLRLLAGVLIPEKGRVLLNEIEMKRSPDEGRRLLGMVAEEPGLYSRLTLRGMLAFFAGLFDTDPKEALRRLSPLIEELRMTEFLDEAVGTYSKGMAQKASFLRALVHDPPFLLYDEPTSALDPASALAVQRIIKRLAQKEGKGVLVCTHNLPEAEFVGNRVAMMVQGRLVLREEMELFKRQLGHGIRFEFLLARPPADSPSLLERLKERVKGLNEEMRITITMDETKDRLLVSSSRPAETHPLILAALHEMNCPAVSVAPAPGELESAYLSLIETHHAKNEGEDG